MTKNSPNKLKFEELGRGADFIQMREVVVEDAEHKGQKFDSDKEYMACIPPHAELIVAKVLTFGAKKYDRENWRQIDRFYERYLDAALRHINAHRRGEDNDDESGLDHLAHAVCCLLFILEKQAEEEDES